jgi:pyrroline-5-carboxylate reductase
MLSSCLLARIPQLCVCLYGHASGGGEYKFDGFKMKLSEKSGMQIYTKHSDSSSSNPHESSSPHVWRRYTFIKELFLRQRTLDRVSAVDDVNSLEEFITCTLERRNFAHWQNCKPIPNLFDRLVEKLTDSPIALVGAGKMGSSILESWLALGLRREWIIVVEPKPSDELVATTNRERISLISDIRQLPQVSVLFLAIKPQEADQVLHYFRHFIGNNTLVISIMAGKSISFIAQKIERRAAIVRAMPNLAATIGRSITAAIANDLAEEYHYKIAFALLRATGTVQWIDEEPWMDAITAVSGSGPAYVFLLAEELARAGVEAGLPAELAIKLARETITGSGELLHRSDLSSDTLRQNVTSPGGTTAAALEVLMADDGMQQLMTRAVAAATRRSRELAK